MKDLVYKEYYEDQFSLNEFIDNLEFHAKKTPTPSKTLSGTKIWRNITSDYPADSSLAISKDIKLNLLDILDSMSGMSNEIKINWPKVSNKNDFLTVFQEGAISIGEQLEDILGENRITSFMEQLCENIYNLSFEENDIHIYTNNIDELISNAKDELSKIREKYTCFFLPYQHSMWDSMESIWMEACKDPNWDIFVMPIPYFERNSDGSVGEPHYEGLDFVSQTYIKSFNEVNLKEYHPNVIFFHNPYDKYNLVTMVHPDYFSSNLKTCADTLVYVPYDMPVNNHVKAHYIKTPGPLFANKVMLASEEIKQLYISGHREWFKELGLSAPTKSYEKKFIATGSPKVDKLLMADEETIMLPLEWGKKIGLLKNKKIILFDTHISSLMPENGNKILLKLKSIFETIKSREDVFLIWRPHPLSHNTIISMNPEILDEYEKIENDISSSEWGLIDTSSSALPAMLISDGYYGDGASLYELYKYLEKPILHHYLDILS